MSVLYCILYLTTILVGLVFPNASRGVWLGLAVVIAVALAWDIRRYLQRRRNSP